MSTQVVTRRCGASPISESIMYDGVASVVTVLSAPNRSDTLRFELQTPTGIEVTEWAPPVPGSRFDARSADGVAQRIRIIHRRSAALLSIYNVSLGIEDRDSPRTLWSPNLARSAQGIRLGTTICTAGAYVSLGGFIAWDTGSLRIVLHNQTGAFTVPPRIQLEAGDAVQPYDVSDPVAVPSLSGAGAWRYTEHHFSGAVDSTADPTVITGREYYVRLQNNEAADQQVTADVYIQPAGISR